MRVHKWFRSPLLFAWLGGAVLVFSFGGSVTYAEEKASPQNILAAFAAAVQASGATPAQKKSIAKKLAPSLAATASSADPRVITEALIQLRPDDFRPAMIALNNENWQRATARFAKLVADADPWLAAHARYYLARAYIHQERFEDAAPYLDSLLPPHKPYTLFTAEANFWRGVAYVSELKRAAAIASFQAVLDQPGSSPALRQKAQAINKRLRAFKKDSLPEVMELMGFSRRRLFLADSGRRVQKKQKRAVDILNAIIKKIEEEKKKKQQQQSQGQGQGGQSAGKPGSGAKSSSLPPGATTMGALGRANRGRKQDEWGNLPARDRKAVEAVLKARFPKRYRELVEQYYRSLQEEE